MLLSRLLLLAAVLAVSGCASEKTRLERQELDLKKANTRALEQRRMNLLLDYADEGMTARGAEIAIYDPEKKFDPSLPQFGRATTYGTKAAPSSTFGYEDKVRTKSFGTKEAYTKSSWMGDAKFATKEAPTKESWFSRMTARTKSYDTKASPMQDKTSETRALPGGDRVAEFKGRRQSDFDSRGPVAASSVGESWTGDLKQLSIEDVKKLLNKN